MNELLIVFVTKFLKKKKKENKRKELFRQTSRLCFSCVGNKNKTQKEVSSLSFSEKLIVPKMRKKKNKLLVNWKGTFSFTFFPFFFSQDFFLQVILFFWNYRSSFKFKLIGWFVFFGRLFGRFFLFCEFSRPFLIFCIVYWNKCLIFVCCKTHKKTFLGLTREKTVYGFYFLNLLRSLVQKKVIKLKWFRWTTSNNRTWDGKHSRHQETPEPRIFCKWSSSLSLTFSNSCVC